MVFFHSGVPLFRFKKGSLQNWPNVCTLELIWRIQIYPIDIFGHLHQAFRQLNQAINFSQLAFKGGRKKNRRGVNKRPLDAFFVYIFSVKAFPITEMVICCKRLQTVGTKRMEEGNWW